MGVIKTKSLKHIKYKFYKYPEFPEVQIAYESGTNKGTQTRILSFMFNEVITVELSSMYYNTAYHALKGFNNVILFNANTLDVLPKVCQKDKPIFFYLDAHYCKCDPPIKKSEFPLFKELEMIKARNKYDIVVVDDVHTFGKVRNDLKFKDGNREWEIVTPEYLLDFFGDRVAGSEVVDDAFVIWLKGVL